MSWDPNDKVFMPNYQLLRVLKKQKFDRTTYKYFEEEQVRSVGKGLVDGLLYLHTRNIVHRDIKPENILLDETNEAVIGDLGKAKILKCDEEDMTAGMEGTMYFMPPEAHLFEVDQFSLKKADIWALGVSFYCMVFNRLPYNMDQVSSIDIGKHILK
jgi:serine/threonine protein kinase